MRNAIKTIPKEVVSKEKLSLRDVAIGGCVGAALPIFSLSANFEHFNSARQQCFADKTHGKSSLSSN